MEYVIHYDYGQNSNGTFVELFVNNIKHLPDALRVEGRTCGHVKEVTKETN